MADHIENFKTTFLIGMIFRNFSFLVAFVILLVREWKRFGRRNYFVPFGLARCGCERIDRSFFQRVRKSGVYNLNGINTYELFICIGMPNVNRSFSQTIF